MNATKETPTAEPVDPNRDRFRQAMAYTVGGAAVFAAGRVAVVRGFDLRPDQPLYETVLWSSLNGGLLALFVVYLVMMMMPATARRYGLPALPGDERERHHAYHAYQVSYIVGLAGTVGFALVTNNLVMFGVSVAIQLSYFLTLIVLNRKA